MLMIKKVKVLLAEHDSDWIEVFENEIRNDARFIYLGYTQTPESAIKMACDLEPDVVVMDIYFDHSSLREYGIHAARKIRISSNSKIVFFTNNDDTELLLKACRIGLASGFIRKHDYSNYGDEIYNAVTTMTPLKCYIIRDVRNQLNYTGRDVLTKIINRTIEGTKDSEEWYDERTVSRYKTKIYKAFGFDKDVHEKDREGVLRRVFKTW